MIDQITNAPHLLKMWEHQVLMLDQAEFNLIKEHKHICFPNAWDFAIWDPKYNFYEVYFKRHISIHDALRIGKELNEFKN